MWRFLSLTRHENQLPVLLLWDLLPWWDSWGEQMHFDNSIDFVHIHNYFNCNFFFVSVERADSQLVNYFQTLTRPLKSQMWISHICCRWRWCVRTVLVQSRVQISKAQGERRRQRFKSCKCTLYMRPFHAVQVKCSNVHKVISIIREEKRREGQSGGVIANKCF